MVRSVSPERKTEAKKNKLPKRIAGVIPIPKLIRRPANKLMKTPTGRDLLAGALVALAGGAHRHPLCSGAGVI